MREIKFRGVDSYYSKQNGYFENAWKYGSLIINDDGSYAIGNAIKCGCTVISSKVIPETVGQYTETKDINGSEIYDGHILHREGYWDIRIKYEKGVFWVRDADRVRYNNKITNQPIADFDLNEYKIIGNTYDNPELIE